jgi:hypothetical protein
MMTREEKILARSIAFIFIVLCTANVLLLPPYEGFDESAHYSYISILSDRHEIPDFRYTPLDAVVEDDRRGLPRPYSSVPPFEVNGGITYSEFFNTGSPLQRDEAAKRLWQKPKAAASYSSGHDPNWQGQHPPLYYLVMIPAYRFCKNWSPGMRLLFLRLFSVALACGSLVFWFKTVKLFKSSSSRRFLLLAGLAIVFLPSLWYDLARLGNDSLAALLFAGSFYFLLSTYLNAQKRLSDFVGLSLTLAMGLLTKLFFLPLLVGTILFCLWLGATVTKLGLKSLLVRCFIVCAGPLLLAGWWFIFCDLRYGMSIVSYDTYSFQQIVNPPVLTNGQFVTEMMRIIAGFGTAFLWCGTWSWVRPPVYIYGCFVPLFALMIWGLISFLRKEGQTDRRQILIGTTLLLLPLVSGFFYEMYLVVKFTGQGIGPGGWHLFFAWPIIGIWFSFSFEMKKTRVLKLAILLAFALVSFFDVAGVWRSALVYGGIIKKIGTIKTGVGFLVPTIGNAAMVIDRLGTLTFPRTAAILYGIAIFQRFALAAWAISFVSLPVSERSEVSEPA